MNKIYKVVWSKAKHCYVVTSELAKRQTKGCGARSLRMATVSLGVAASLLCSGAVIPVFGESVAEAAVTVSDAANPVNNVTPAGGVKNYPLAGAALGFKVYAIDVSKTTDKELVINGSSNNTESAKNGFVGIFSMEDDVTGGGVSLENGVTVGALIGGGSYANDVASSTAKVTGGTVDIGMYGGFSYSGKATGNSIEISGTDTVINANSAGGTSKYSKVAGGSGKTGASKNTVTISGGTINSGVCGGYVEEGVAGGSNADEGNRVIINDGEVKSNVYGGYSDKGNVTNNSVSLNKGSIYGTYGGYTDAGDAIDNKVVIKDGEVKFYYGAVTGGYSHDGNATDNTVTINGGNLVNNNGVSIKGGTASGKDNNAKNNKVIISNGTIGSDAGSESDNYFTVIGGYGSGGDATDNTVTISGGKFTGQNVFKFYGGESYTSPSTMNAGETFAATSAANNNTLEISGGTYSKNVEAYGGWTMAEPGAYAGTAIATVTADKNTVTISGGTYSGNTDVYGGYVFARPSAYGTEATATAEGTASNNTVVISGGTFSGKVNVYGGYGKSATAGTGTLTVKTTIINNNVFIKKGTLNGDVYGGFSSSTGTNNVDGNTVSISKDATIGGNVYGGKVGYNKTGNVTYNSVTMSGGTVGGFVFGGHSEQTSGAGTVSDNTVEITGGTISGIGHLAGGYVGYYSDDANKFYVKDNIVKVSNDVDIRCSIMGGRAQGDAIVQNNQVEFDANNVDHGISIIGGSAGPGGATSNIVIFKKGIVNNVTGGSSNGSTATLKGDVSGNTVEISGGTVYKGVVGGDSSFGNADNNIVTISGGTVNSSDYLGAVVGGCSGGGTAQTENGNQVIINGTANVKGDVSGGADGYYTAIASENTVTVDGSAVVTGKVMGASGKSRDKTKNKVYINKGSVTGDVFGAYLDDSKNNFNSDDPNSVWYDKGNANSNEVHISGGTVTGSVYGGAIKDKVTGDVKGNIVEVTGGTINEGKYVYGGYSVSNSVGGSEDGEGNKVIVSGGEVKSTVLGGFSSTAAAMGNSVEVSGEGKVSASVYGGYSSSGTAGGDGTNDGNKVIVSGGEVQGAVTGGYSNTAAAKGNSVEITGGKVGLNADAVSYIYGGFSNKAAATGNKVSISNGTAGEKRAVNIFGGYSGSGAADTNEVSITGGTVGKVNSSYISDIYGGRGQTSALGNTVTIEAGTLKSSVYGGYSNGKADGNIINKSGGTVIGWVYGGRGGTSASQNKITISGGDGGYVYGGDGLLSNSSTVNQNEVTVKGKDTVVNNVYGGSNGAEINGNKVLIEESTVNNLVYGGNSDSAGTVKNNEVTISDATVKGNVFGGASHRGLISKNTVAITNSMIGGNVFGGNQSDDESGTGYTVAGNIVTIKGGTFTADKKIYGGFTYSGSTTDNIINLTGSTTGLEGVEVYGGSQSANTGNELHVGGTKTYDGSGNLVSSVGDAWQGSSNNTVKTVANFETIALHSVAWNPDVAALAATTVDNIGTLDIKDMQFDKTPSNGESMALLKAENDLGVVGIGLAYKDGSEEKTATSAELAAGVTFDSGALTDTAVNGVSVTGTQDKKVSLENSNKEIRYSFSSTITGITIATNTFTADGTARKFGSGDNLTGATITNNLAFSDESKNSMQSGQSMVILDATNAVAVGGATLPDFGPITYDETFSDAIGGKVVTLSGTHTDTLALNSSNTQLTYTVGDMQVSDAKFDGNITWDNSVSYYTADTKYKFSGTTNIDATNLTVTGTSTNLLKVGDAMTLLSAEDMTASITNDQSADNKTASKITINYSDSASGITLGAEATGAVKAATNANAVNYEVTSVTLKTVDLTGWTGTEAGLQSETTGWTVNSETSITTGELANAGLAAMNPGDRKTILTADTAVDFSAASITGNKAWQTGGPIDDTADTSGVSVAGETTGGGVTFDSTNKNVLIYQKDKKTIDSITLGSVAFTKDGTVRSFDNTYDLTGASFTTTGFGISNASTATMNAGDTMVVVDAADAIKGTGDVTLKGFARQNAGDAIAFTDPIDGKALTLSGTHQDTLEQNEAKNQILYKVGDKEVNKVTFTGEVAWNDSEAYYTNDASKYRFNGATDIDVTALKVTGTTDKALIAGTSKMTLLSAEGMTAGTVTPQSDASKITVSYSDATSGIGFGAEATGAVSATANAVNYTVDEVTLKTVDLGGWNGTTAVVTEGWSAPVNSVAVNNADAITVVPTTTQAIVTAGSSMFADVNVEKVVDFDPVAQNGVTLTGTQTNTIKTTQTNVANDTITYEVGKKDVKTIDIGTVEWSGEALDGSGADYNYAGASVDHSKFEISNPEQVEANTAMTLLKANETLAEMAEETKKASYAYSPVSGVRIDGDITGTMSRSGNNIMFAATENKASQLTFTDVEWKDTLMTRPANIVFDGAKVVTTDIKFTNIDSQVADQTMTLVKDFDGTPSAIEGDHYMIGSGRMGEGAAEMSDNDLIFRAKTGTAPTEATHETVMAMEAGTAVVAAGREYVDSAVEGLGLVSNMAPDGTSTFASMGGGVGRYKTGSHVDTHTWSAVVAVGSKREHKKGNLEWGVFAEYGRGNYTLHDDNGGRGDGDTNYAGGGLLAKWTNKHDVYTEASVRMGRMSDSASNMLMDRLGNSYGYDIHANYFGAHVGLGKIIKVKKNRDLDVYGKYFYLRRNGVDFDAGGNHYTLDSVTSSLLRIGARYGSNDKKWNWYGGLAYEYEFGGESKGTVDGLAIRSASIKGGSVRGEIGMRMEATKTNPWKVDIGIYGYGGKHRGFGGNVNVAYMF